MGKRVQVGGEEGVPAFLAEGGVYRVTALSKP